MNLLYLDTNLELDGFRKVDEFKLGFGTEGKIIKLTEYGIDINTTIPIIQLSATL